MNHLAVIIPAINESEHLRTLLAQLNAQENIELEVIVSDGGSCDDSKRVCMENHARFIPSPKGRCKQMNFAVTQTQCDMLLFMHADCRIDEPQLLAQAVEYLIGKSQEHGKDNIAGHFPLVFNRELHSAKHNFAYRYMEDKTALNRPDTINGDQGLLISRKFFINLGGFDESLNFLEDQRISHRIFQTGQWIVLPGRLNTSARRFESNGMYRLSILMAMIMVLYRANVDIFFELAPKIYLEQSKTGNLLLAPFFKLTWTIPIVHYTLKETIMAWYRAGTYVRSNTWLLFYFLDQIFQPIYKNKIFPLLGFHDRIVYPVTNNAIFNTIATIISYFLFSWVFFGFFVVLEVFSSNRVTAKK